MSDQIARLVRALCDTHNIPESSDEAERADALMRWLVKRGYTLAQATRRVDAKLRRNSSRTFNQWLSSLKKTGAAKRG